MALATLCTGTGATSRDGATALLDGRSTAAGTGGIADVSAATSAGALAALRPRGGVQRLGLRVYIDQGGSPEDRLKRYIEPEGYWEPDYLGGQRIDQHLVGGWRFTSSLGRPVQEGSLTFAVPAGGSPLGSQMAVPAPVPGGRHVDAHLVYKYGGSELVFPLMQVGLVDSSRRVDDGTVTDQCALTDIVSRLRDTPATLQLPAGHGLSYSQVIRKLLLAIGPGLADYISVPPIPGDFAFRKEVNLVEGDALALINELCDVWGLHLFADGYGIITTALNAPELQRGPVLGVIDERDILRSVNGQIETVEETAMPEAWTHLCVQGTTQLTRDPGSQRRSVELPAKSTAFFAPGVARYQTSGASVVDNGTTSTAASRLRSDSLTTLDIDGETVVGISTATKGWTNLSAARYNNNTSLVLTQISGVYLEENTAGALGYAWPTERFIELSASFTTNEYDSDNRFKRQTVVTYGYHHTRRAVQSRALRTSQWTDYANAPGVAGLMLGNGEGVTTQQPTWGEVERRIIEEDSSSDGYRTFRRTSVYGYHLQDGWEYRYGDGRESSDSQEVFRLYQVVEEKWAPVPGREDLHVYLRQEFGVGGELRRQDQETRQGSLQPVDVRRDLAPAQADYATTAEWQLAAAASRIEVQPMLAKHDDDAMLNYRPPREQTLTLDYAQQPWQLLNFIRRLLWRGRAKAVTFSVAPNPLYRLGTWWRVRYRRAGMDIDHDGIVSDSTFERRGARGPVVQRLTVLVYPAGALAA